MLFPSAWAEGSVRLENAVSIPVTKPKKLNTSSNAKCSGSDHLDLTNLQWLQDFSLCNTTGGQYVGENNQSGLSDAPTSPLEGDLASIGIPVTPGKPILPALPAMCSLPVMAEYRYCAEEIDYRTNPHIKPPYTYAKLICLAIQASENYKITLANIYKWISDNFCYFRHTESTWQNSIRHNLSVNKSFVKVSRQKDEPGKGGYWTIDPEHAGHLLRGLYKKREMPRGRINPDFKTQQSDTVPTNVPAANIAETTPFDGCSAAKGHKRKNPFDQQGRVAKVPSLSHRTEEPKVREYPDREAQLNSDTNEGCSTDEGGPLNPVPKNQDLVVHGIVVNPMEASVSAESILIMETQRDGDGNAERETLSAPDFVQDPQSEQQNHPDLLCVCTMDVNQVFEIEQSFGELFGTTVLSVL